MLQRAIAAGVRRADYLLQPHFRLVQQVFVPDPTAQPGAGVYTAEEWSRIRHRQTVPSGNESDRYGSDEAYLEYLAAIRESKMLSVQSLVRTFDFGRYKSIIELGCGDMPQAYLIHSSYPGLSYTATDFDADVIERCARLPLLGAIRKSVLDVTGADLDELGNHDLVMSWSLEFSLEDDQLVGLFGACRARALPYLLCTHTAIGPLGCLVRAVARKGRDQGAQGHVRKIGWLRSIGEIARLARLAGMTLRSRSYHVNHAALLFAPA